jgi:hypothetical protein
MPIALNCTGCGRPLRLPDSLAGKQAKCPQCRTVFAVPGGRPTAASTARSERWHVHTAEGETFGPVTRHELDQWVSEGRLTADCQVLQEGDQEWRWASEVYPDLGSQRSEESTFAIETRRSDRPSVITPGSVTVVPDSARPRRLHPHRGTLILVLGILSLVACGPLGLPAWIMGSADLKAMRAGRMDRSGESQTQVGMILGIIACAIIALGGLIIVGFLALGLAAAA